MAATELVSGRVKGDDDEFEPKERYSSNNVIAAQELTFNAKKKAETIKNKQKQGIISKKEAKTELKAAYKTLTHTLDKISLEKELQTNLENGLSGNEYQTLLEKWGENMLTPPKHDPWWWRLIKSIFGGFFNMLLWVGGILCFISYGIDPKDQTNFWLGVVLCTVVTLTGIFGYYQEGKSADLMKSLSALNKASDVSVFRNGKISVVPPITLVPGDIVELKSGQAVPADVRVFWCSPDMEVNNASLTGEADPLKRDWRPENDDVPPAESKNLMFFGTSVVNGNGKCVVYATGDNTFMGRTAQLASATEGEDTPIAKEIKDFVFKVSIIAFTLGISFFIIGMIDNGDIVRNVVFLIGIIVANVPEGLLATVTVSLTLTAKKMYTKNVRVKNLESVETLGSTSVICSDKTGTLTTSVMTCQHVYYDLEERLADTSNPYQSLVGDFYNEDKSRKPDFLRLIRCAALCSNADFIDDPKSENNGQVQPGANPTEAAMVKFSSGHIAAEYQINVPRYRQIHKKLHEIPFNSKNKWQVSIHELTNDYVIGDEKPHGENDEKKSDQPPKHGLIQMKGAPERILGLCDRYFHNGESYELTEEIRKKIMDGVLALGAKGERVLALAELQLNANEYDLNVLEPITKSDYGEEIDENLKDKACVVVVWEDNERIEIDLSSVKNDDGEDVPFNELIVRYVGRALVNKVNLKYSSIRLHYGDHGRLAGDETFKVLKISPGSVFYGYKGPFKFEGTNSESVNFPFNRSNEEGLQFLGLYAMIDPPRPGVPEAVLKCQSAGIRVIMVTGDHPVTAKAIAQQVNIIGHGGKTIEDVAAEKYNGNKSQVKEDEYNAVVVPGWELQKVLDTESEDPQGVATFWNVTLKQPNVVFARTSPQQKLLIVAAVQERGGIVAVTGDGVNDSPALKKADIGVAMGITGTDVAKEAADMILLDDNFASIVNGVEEGRIIFDNLKKSIAYTLSSNIPEIAPFLLFQVAGIPLPLTTTMILLVDLGTDLAPAISMAYEGREADIMKRPPRNPLIHKLVTWKLISFSYLQIGMLQALAGFYAYFVVLNGYGIPYSYTPKMDSHRAFGFSTDDSTNRDAYWMWCFNDNARCVYSPEFSFSWLNPNRKTGQVSCNPVLVTGTNIPPCYYYQELFSQYQRKHEDPKKPQFRTYMKQHLVDTCKKLKTTCNSDVVTKNLLNGMIENHEYLIWKYENFTETDVKTCLKSGTTGTQNPPNLCQRILGPNVAPIATSVDVIHEFQPTWETSIEPYYRSKLVINNLLPNRFCYEDYSRYYTVSDFNKHTIQCNERDHPVKPKTFIHFPTNTTEDIVHDPNFDTKHSRQYSLFPMSMATRTKALSQANTAYFISIIVVQWADLMICKTRIRSLFEQGMTNTFMNFALICETLLGAAICYLPLDVVLGTSALKFIWWTAAVPFSLMIYIYDEVRKGYIRKQKGSWIHRNTYW